MKKIKKKKKYYQVVAFEVIVRSSDELMIKCYGEMRADLEQWIN